MAEPLRQRSPVQGPLPRPEVPVAESVEDLAEKSADELRAILDDLIKSRLAAAEAHRLEALTSRRAQEAELLGIDLWLAKGTRRAPPVRFVPSPRSAPQHPMPAPSSPPFSPHVRSLSVPSARACRRPGEDPFRCQLVAFNDGMCKMKYLVWEESARRSQGRWARRADGCSAGRLRRGCVCRARCRIALAVGRWLRLWTHALAVGWCEWVRCTHSRLHWRLGGAGRSVTTHGRSRWLFSGLSALAVGWRQLSAAHGRLRWLAGGVGAFAALLAIHAGCWALRVDLPHLWPLVLAILLRR